MKNNNNIVEFITHYGTLKGEVVFRTKSDLSIKMIAPYHGIKIYAGHIPSPALVGGNYIEEKGEKRIVELLETAYKTGLYIDENLDQIKEMLILYLSEQTTIQQEEEAIKDTFNKSALKRDVKEGRVTAIQYEDLLKSNRNELQEVSTKQSNLSRAFIEDILPFSKGFVGFVSAPELIDYLNEKFKMNTI